MFRYIHNDTERQRAEIEEAVTEGILYEVEKDATRYPNKVKEICYGGYWFTIEYVVPDFSPLEEIGLNFRQEKFGRYEFYYTGYDKFFVVARPWDYNFSRVVEIMYEEDWRPIAVYFSVEEAEAVGKFFDLNFPQWRTPYGIENDDHDWYAQAMVAEYGDEAWGWSYDQEARW